ncbi:unnamed protein product [Arctia plantaginis]|uniref:Sugar phosphate transporter domain-containing protein n=1 Tax=Arctia plantaginis TaxID=874455 RepID=A0A8S1B052_ARCPL|nr:unnamed protein product [Arctia plantaginis]
MSRIRTLGRMALVLFLPVWVWRDGAALWQGARPRGGWLTVGALLAADGLLAWLQAVAAFSVLSRVTPLAYAVASAAKARGRGRRVTAAAAQPRAAAQLGGHGAGAAGRVRLQPRESGGAHAHSRSLAVACVTYAPSVFTIPMK